MKRTDRLLWTRWRQERRQDAFTELVRPHLRFAVDFARRIGCSPADADDVVQQSLTSLLQESSDRPIDVGIRAWLGRSVSLQARMTRRSESRRHHRERHAPRPRGESISTIERRDEVDRALDALPDKIREAVVLRYLHDMEYREIAHVLGISENACRLRVHRGLEALRDRMGTKPEPLIALIPLLAGAGADAPWPVFPAAATSAAVAGTGVVLMKKWILIGLVAAVAAIGVVATSNASDGQNDDRERATDTERAERTTNETATPSPIPQKDHKPEKAPSTKSVRSTTDRLVDRIWNAGGAVSGDPREAFRSVAIDRPQQVRARRLKKGETRPENITGVWLSDAKLADFLDLLVQTESLVHLGLFSCELTDAQMEHLVALPDLRGLAVGRTNVGNDGLRHLARITSLERLALHNTKVTDDGLAHLAALPNLRHLDIHDLRITDAGLKHVGHIRSLESIQLGETRITDEGFRHLSSLPGLVHLDLGEARVTGSGVRHLKLDRLESLTAEESSRIDDGVLSSLRGARALRVLNLEETSVSDKGLVHLVDHPALEFLHIGGTRVTTAGMRYLSGMSRLERLVLDDTTVGDEAIQDLARCRALRVLRIRNTSITKEGAAQLRKLLPNCDVRWE